MTVKLQDGKVITKDGKVSCGCCFACLSYLNYPASEFLQNFQFEDLPNEFTLGVPVESGQDPINSSFLFTKVDSLYYLPDFTGNNPFPVLYKTPTTGSGGSQTYNFLSFNQFINSLGNKISSYFTLTAVIPDEGFEHWTDPFFDFLQSGAIGPSLFVEPISEDEYFFIGGFGFDSFANSYNISGPSGNFTVMRGPRQLSDIFPGGPPDYPDEQMVLPTFFCNNLDASGNPTEVPANITYYFGDGASLYFDYIVALDLLGDTIVSSSCKWKIKTPDGTFEKSGTQDTPVGSYGGGFTVS